MEENQRNKQGVLFFRQLNRCNFLIFFLCSLFYFYITLFCLIIVVLTAMRKAMLQTSFFVYQLKIIVLLLSSLFFLCYIFLFASIFIVSILVMHDHGGKARQPKLKRYTFLIVFLYSLFLFVVSLYLFYFCCTKCRWREASPIVNKHFFCWARYRGIIFLMFLLSCLFLLFAFCIALYCLSLCNTNSLGEEAKQRG